jgi:hypothetical protein
MAYFIFLKYLDSLEDFRKNPHVKIPPKSSPSKFPKPWYIKKSNFYSEKNFSFTFGPIGPVASQPIRPFSPAAAQFFFFFPNRPLPLSQLGLGLSAGLARPHCPTGHLLPPPVPEQSVQAAIISRPHAAPWSAPTTSTRGKITAASLLLHSPIK